MTFSEHLNDWLDYHQQEFARLAQSLPSESHWWATLMAFVQIDERPAIKAIQAVFEFAGAPTDDIPKAYAHFKSL